MIIISRGKNKMIMLGELGKGCTFEYNNEYYIISVYEDEDEYDSSSRLYINLITGEAKSFANQCCRVRSVTLELREIPNG